MSHYKFVENNVEVNFGLGNNGYCFIDVSPEGFTQDMELDDLSILEYRDERFYGVLHVLKEQSLTPPSEMVDSLYEEVVSIDPSRSFVALPHYSEAHLSTLNFKSDYESFVKNNSYEIQKSLNCNNQWENLQFNSKLTEIKGEGKDITYMEIESHLCPNSMMHNYLVNNGESLSTGFDKIYPLDSYKTFKIDGELYSRNNIREMELQVRDSLACEITNQELDDSYPESAQGHFMTAEHEIPEVIDIILKKKTVIDLHDMYVVKVLGVERGAIEKLREERQSLKEDYVYKKEIASPSMNNEQKMEISF